MTPDEVVHMMEAIVIPVGLFVISHFLRSNTRHNENLYNKLDQFRNENTTGIKELGTEIKETLINHTDQLVDHHGRISTLEGMKAYGRRKDDR